MTRRVIITGDLLRPQEEAFRPAQRDNIRWFHRLVRRPLAAATGLPVETVLWDHLGPGFDAPGFYAAAGATPDVEGWVSLFDAPALTIEAAAMMVAAYADAAMVVGFELAEIQKRLLTQARIPWIDVNIHPYRFGPDLLFAIATGEPEVMAGLRRHHADDLIFEPWADLMAATVSRIPPHRPILEPCLVVGQTRVDRALIRDGRLLDLAHFAPALREAVGEEGRVLFKPHPYNPGGFGIHHVGLPLSRIREVPDNSYVLLGQDAVKRVIGVSSSLVAEARFFGKEGVFLGTPPFHIAPSRQALRMGLHASVVDAWAAADFWRDLLAPLLPVTAHDGHRPVLPPNALRASLRQFWGWDEIFLQLPWDIAAARAAAR
ncbi:hypothetical protein [Falsiroseomonas stagni]|uniref:Capsule polysaccharide biosynthesis protein n=1 Tax=Falsiroseomonas stagni DSM 19981 TaxID=1123062 RepID=A0A1I4BH74_9PROT|nr:hypothetical protein [Falsiroseomonas stagni]SFK68175.1 hypothetical protein SAMN02745775_105303 [Falsiroseomonas stagni DSM 19981]